MPEEEKKAEGEEVKAEEKPAEPSPADAKPAEDAPVKDGEKPRWALSAEREGALPCPVLYAFRWLSAPTR